LLDLLFQLEFSDTVKCMSKTQAEETSQCALHNAQILKRSNFEGTLEWYISDDHLAMRSTRVYRLGENGSSYFN